MHLDYNMCLYFEGKLLKMTRSHCSSEQRRRYRGGGVVWRCDTPFYFPPHLSKLGFLEFGFGKYEILRTSTHQKIMVENVWLPYCWQAWSKIPPLQHGLATPLAQTGQ